jgi:hypothetical protein
MKSSPNSEADQGTKTVLPVNESNFVPLVPGALGSVWVTRLKSPANQ